MLLLIQPVRNPRLRGLGMKHKAAICEASISPCILDAVALRFSVRVNPIILTTQHLGKNSPGPALTGTGVGQVPTQFVFTGKGLI